MIATSTSSLLIAAAFFVLGALFGRSTKGLFAKWVDAAKTKIQQV